MIAHTAHGEKAPLGNHRIASGGFGLAGTRNLDDLRNVSTPAPHDEVATYAAQAAQLRRHTTVGHWLHSERCSRDLNLTQLERLPGGAGNQVAAVLGRAIEATQAAVRPFSFSVAPIAQGLRIEGETVAVAIACHVLESASQCTPQEIANPQQTDRLIAQAIDTALKCDLSLVLNGLPKYLSLQSVSQAAFLQILLNPDNQLVLGLGPTGTGKTYLAIVAALNQLAEERVQRIVLTRPHVVEEGEVVTADSRNEMGVDHQFAFFDDILFELLGPEKVARMKQDLKLEIIPLGRMRGRTFNNAYVVIDEAQNMSIARMRMAVTRIGTGTRMVLTGDPSHLELLGGEKSGLVDLISLVRDTDIATIHRFEKRDIVRNDIVARLDRLYASRPTMM